MQPQKAIVGYLCGVLLHVVRYRSEVNDGNQTGTRHYLQCIANLLTRRLELCLITFQIIPNIDCVELLTNRS